MEESKAICDIDNDVIILSSPDEINPPQTRQNEQPDVVVIDDESEDEILITHERIVSRPASNPLEDESVRLARRLQQMEQEEFDRRNRNRELFDRHMALVLSDSIEQGANDTDDYSYNDDGEEEESEEDDYRTRYFPASILTDFLGVGPAGFVSEVVRNARRQQRAGAASNNMETYEQLLALDSRVKSKGFSKSEIDSFPTHLFSTKSSSAASSSTAPQSHYSSTQCAICLDEYSSRQKIMVLFPCRHSFHAKCCRKWLGSHRTCPVCRSQITVPSNNSSTSSSYST